MTEPRSAQVVAISLNNHMPVAECSPPIDPVQEGGDDGVRCGLGPVLHALGSQDPGDTRTSADSINVLNVESAHISW